MLLYSLPKSSSNFRMIIFFPMYPPALFFFFLSPILCLLSTLNKQHLLIHTRFSVPLENFKILTVAQFLHLKMHRDCYYDSLSGCGL